MFINTTSPLRRTHSFQWNRCLFLPRGFPMSKPERTNMIEGALAHFLMSRRKRAGKAGKSWMQRGEYLEYHPTLRVSGVMSVSEIFRELPFANGIVHKLRTEKYQGFTRWFTTKWDDPASIHHVVRSLRWCKKKVMNVYLHNVARPRFSTQVSNMHFNLKSNKSKPHGHEGSFRPIDPRWSSMPVLGKYSAFKQHHKDRLHSAEDSQNKFHSMLLPKMWLLYSTINAQDKQASLASKQVSQCLVQASSSSFQTWIKLYSLRE